MKRKSARSYRSLRVRRDGLDGVVSAAERGRVAEVHPQRLAGSWIFEL
jgi:hypothetical protein